jgi:hypothetical protein
MSKMIISIYYICLSNFSIDTSSKYAINNFFIILRVNTNYFTFFQTNKPLTEKRRRERINNSLMQLKTLVLRGTNKEVGDLPDPFVEIKIRNSLLDVV